MVYENVEYKKLFEQSNLKWLEQGTILLTVAGSHAYGISTPQSDIRNGKYSYEEILKMSEDLDLECKELYEKNKISKTIPNSPNVESINELTLTLVEIAPLT